MDKEKLDKIIETARMKIAISNLNEKEGEKMTKNKILQTAATFILVIGITTGIAYASTIVYEKIWKEPGNFNVSKNISDEEKQKCITKEEAIQRVESYLKKIGLNEETIKRIYFDKDFVLKENIWSMDTQIANISVDAITGQIISIRISTDKYTIPENYGISREEARKVANELLEKYRPEDDKGQYELVKLTRNLEIDEQAYIWYAIFQKKYDNLLNENEEISISWIPTINGLYNLSFKRDVYENNEEIISKEDAIKIAIERDQQIEENNIISVEAEIKIKKMNEQVYLREKYGGEYENTIFDSSLYKNDKTWYKTENIVRKVWCVVLNYDKTQSKGLNEFTYFVDCTTGEIIGGVKWNLLKSEQSVYDDPNNLIIK